MEQNGQTGHAAQSQMGRLHEEIDAGGHHGGAEYDLQILFHLAHNRFLPRDKLMPV